jgi:hypothetical protein
VVSYGYIRGSHSARTADGTLLINQSNGAPFIDPNEDMIGDPNLNSNLVLPIQYPTKDFS